MKKIINNLKKQPEEVRRHILHILILVIIIVMVLLWVLSLRINFSNPDTKVKIKQDLQPFSVLKDNIINGFNSTKNTDYSIE